MTEDESEFVSGPPVETIRRALRVLSCFRVDQPKRGVSDIARETNLHKSTVHRLLATLQLDGFVQRANDRTYMLGWRVVELAAAVPSWQVVHQQAVVDVLKGLVRATGETSYLAVLADDDILVLERLEGTHRLRVPITIGSRLPSSCTSLGKSLLAAQDDEVLLQLLERAELRPFTVNTITDKRKLWEELLRIRAQGFAIDNEELEEGLMCVGANVTVENGPPWAALSISGPTPRIRARLDDCIRAVREAAQSLAESIASNGTHLPLPFSASDTSTSGDSDKHRGMEARTSSGA